MPSMKKNKMKNQHKKPKFISHTHISENLNVNFQFIFGIKLIKHIKYFICRHIQYTYLYL